MDEEIVSISDIIDVLKKKKRIIIVITLITIIISAIYSFFLITPIYSSSVKVFIGKDTTEKTEYNSGDVTMYQKLLKTYSEVITTRDLIEKAIDEKNLDIDVDVDEVVSGIKVSEGNESQVMTIEYKSTNNILTKQVLDAVVDEFIKESKELIPNGKVKIIENSKFPIHPSNLNHLKNILIGCLIGIILGIGFTLVVEFLDNTIKTKEDIEKIIGIPVIGMIPNEGK